MACLAIVNIVAEMTSRVNFGAPVSYGLSLAGVAFIYLGLRKYDGSYYGGDQRIWIIVGLSFIVFMAYSFFNVEMLIQLVSHAIVITVLYLMCLYQLFILRRIRRGEIGRTMLGVVMIISMYIFIIRATLLSISYDYSTAMGSTTIAILVGMALIITNILYLVAIYLMSIERKKAQLENLSHIDPVTTTLNLRGFENHVMAIEARQNRRGGYLAVLCFRIDNFKDALDFKGSSTADQLLMQFVANVVQEIRIEDCFARLNSNEFIVLIDDCDKETAIGLAQLIASKFEEDSISTWPSSVSCSLAIGEGEGLSLDMLIKRCQQRLQSKTQFMKRIELVEYLVED